jgi:hypothetical protein
MVRTTHRLSSLSVRPDLMTLCAMLTSGVNMMSRALRMHIRVRGLVRRQLRRQRNSPDFVSMSPTMCLLPVATLLGFLPHPQGHTPPGWPVGPAGQHAQEPPAGGYSGALCCPLHHINMCLAAGKGQRTHYCRKPIQRPRYQQQRQLGSTDD